MMILVPIAIKEVKKMYVPIKNPKLIQNLSFIYNNYKLVSLTIIKLEKQETSLNESVKLVD